MMVRVDDEDGLSSNELLDRVVLNQILTVSNSFTSVVSQRGVYSKVTMEFSSRVQCDTNYYGSNCLTQCIGQDSDEFGHFTCDSTGRRVCLPGYSGSLCTVGQSLPYYMWSHCFYSGNANYYSHFIATDIKP